MIPVDLSFIFNMRNATSPIYMTAHWIDKQIWVKWKDRPMISDLVYQEWKTPPNMKRDLSLYHSACKFKIPTLDVTLLSLIGGLNPLIASNHGSLPKANLTFKKVEGT